jgi:hypothetical protein
MRGYEFRAKEGGQYALQAASPRAGVGATGAAIRLARDANDAVF